MVDRMDEFGEKENARADVERSTERLEQALGQLKGKIEDSARIVGDFLGDAENVMEELRTDMGSLVEKVEGAVGEAEGLAHELSNPKEFWQKHSQTILAVSLLGGVAAGVFFSEARKRREGPRLKAIRHG